jgi:hypothetical protein
MMMAINGVMDYVMNEIDYDGKVDFFKAIPDMTKNAGAAISASLTKMKMAETTIAAVLEGVGKEFSAPAGPTFSNLTSLPALVSLDTTQ